jgi:hypothetical protein
MDFVSGEVPAIMGKKKHDDDDEELADDTETYTDVPEARPRPYEPPPRRGLLPALSIGDVIALLALIVVSAALLLEGYNKDFKDYSKEIVALFAIVVGFLLGRKT